MTATAAEPSARGGELRVQGRERLRRIHALSGLVPLGVFLAEHLVVNAKALRGPAAFERTTAFVERLPLWSALEIALVLMPLAFHAGYGVVLLLDKTSRAEPSPYAPSWRALNRAAAWVALAFIGYHVWALRVPRWTQGVGAGSVHTVLTAHLSSAAGSAAGVLVPWVAIFYLVGIAATVLHFCVGVWGYVTRFKLVATSKGARKVATASGAFGIVLFALASITVISLAAGSPLFPAPAQSEPCPSK